MSLTQCRTAGTSSSRQPPIASKTAGQSCSFSADEALRLSKQKFLSRSGKGSQTVVCHWQPRLCRTCTHLQALMAMRSPPAGPGRGCGVAQQQKASRVRAPERVSSSVALLEHTHGTFWSSSKTSVSRLAGSDPTHVPNRRELLPFLS